MSNITTVFDACTIINLIHIDSEDEFLIKKLKNLNISISDSVYKEVRANVFKENTDRKRIELALTKFLKYSVSSDTITNDLGLDFYANIKLLSGYRKENGEFYSTALSVYLSQTIPSKLFFYTDDYVAKKDFSSFFNIHQIGGIKDTADLLLLLYRLESNFSKVELIRLLSSLLSEYTTDTSILLKELRKYQIPRNLLRDRDFNIKFKQLINSIDNQSFQNINEIKTFFEAKRHKRYNNVNDILNNHKRVFDLEFISNGYLNKIKNLVIYLKDNEIYRFVS